VRTARAKGLSEWVVVNVHALKNASIPLVTMAGIELGLLLGEPSSRRQCSPGRHRLAHDSGAAK